MQDVVLIIHLLLALAIIGLVLIQRSTGGGLGIGGGGGGMGDFASARSTANALTKATTFCAFCFFGTSLLLSILATHSKSNQSILDDLDQSPAVETMRENTEEDMINDIPEIPVTE